VHPEASTAGGMVPPSAASPVLVLLAREATSTGRVLLLPNSKGFAPLDVNGPFKGVSRCSAVVASACETTKRKKVLPLFLTLTEMILI